MSPKLATSGHLSIPSGPRIPSCSLSPSSSDVLTIKTCQASQSEFHRPLCHPSGLGTAFGDQQ